LSFNYVVTGHFDVSRIPKTWKFLLSQSLWTMIPMDEEPARIRPEYVQILAEKGVKATVSIVEDYRAGAHLFSEALGASQLICPVFQA